MIPLGYLYKHVADRPEWLTAPHVADVYSLSGCVSKPFADYIDYWKHNGYWLFNSPHEITELANAASISLEGLKLFYYEAYELQFDEDGKAWEAFEPEPFATDVVAPISKKLEGFDIASFTMGNMAECSPLSCNSLGSRMPVNAHCLLGSFEEAKAVVEGGGLEECEPGRYRVVAVYSV
ncbi:hypothetical protein [Pinirhizobacter soli]|uniref:hypothetical protein n=1 Tax=Pinirhizobacter soli TaxID=2786953 RepID=UPI00202A21CB|nr:hypothetical protein [Pinirhizobacter soli]